MGSGITGGAIKRENGRAWWGVGLAKGRQGHLEQSLALQLLPGLGPLTPSPRQQLNTSYSSKKKKKKSIPSTLR